MDEPVIIMTLSLYRLNLVLVGHLVPENRVRTVLDSLLLLLVFEVCFRMFLEIVEVH